MKKVIMFFFALALCLSATVVNAQGFNPGSIVPLTEQEMSNINPSSWNQTAKNQITLGLNNFLGIAVETWASGRDAQIAKTLYNSLTAAQKQFMLNFNGARSLNARDAPKCSAYKYGDFWFALGRCKN